MFMFHNGLLGVLDADTSGGKLYDASVGVEGCTRWCTAWPAHLRVAARVTDVVRILQLKVAVGHQALALDTQHWALLILLEIGNPGWSEKQ